MACQFLWNRKSGVYNTEHVLHVKRAVLCLWMWESMPMLSQRPADAVPAAPERLNEPHHCQQQWQPPRLSEHFWTAVTVKSFTLGNNTWRYCISTQGAEEIFQPHIVCCERGDDEFRIRHLAFMTCAHKQGLVPKKGHLEQSLIVEVCHYKPLAHQHHFSD